MQTLSSTMAGWVAAALSLAATIASPVPAAACPDDAVRLVVGYAAGGTGGLVASALAEPLSRELGQTVSVEYVPGGSGAVAALRVSRAPADGCVLLLGQTAEMAINPIVSRDLGYDPAKDLRPVALVATVPLALVVPASSGATTVEALAAGLPSARPTPTFASAGRGTPGYYAGELLRLRTRSSLAHASFDGGGTALQAVAGGSVGLYFPALSTALEEARKGSVRILGVATTRRSPVIPEVPTLDEAGLGPFDLDVWLGIFLPRGAAPALATRLNAAVNQALLRKDVREPLFEKGALVTPSTVDRFDAFLTSERERYRSFIDREFCAQCPW